MLRVDDLEKTMAFFSALGLKETRRKESEKGKFTLVFMASAPGAPEIELTHNWGGETFAPPSRSMGHLAYATDDIYALCRKLQDAGIAINRPPRDGKMAFVKSPDGISVELLQKGDAAGAGGALGVRRERRRVVTRMGTICKRRFEELHFRSFARLSRSPRRASAGVSTTEPRSVRPGDGNGDARRGGSPSRQLRALRARVRV